MNVKRVLLRIAVALALAASGFVVTPGFGPASVTADQPGAMSVASAPDSVGPCPGCFFPTGWPFDD
jgi:hypothetical protein